MEETKASKMAAGFILSALLPVAIMGLELLVEKKNKMLYIISLSTSIIICYYIGYMIAGF